MSQSPDRTSSEARRLAALASYDVLDTPREQDFDDLAALASEICGTPIAVVNLIGEGRQFFKAEVGLGVRETPLDSSFCARTILEEDFLLVPDATKDPRFDCNPLVTGAPHLRFYAGALLKTAEGHPIGTVCVLDYRPRALTEQQQTALRRLARQAMGQLELRRALAARREHGQRLERSEERLSFALGASGMVGTWDWDLKAGVIHADESFARIYTVDPAHAAAGAPLEEYTRNFHPADMPAFQAELDRLLSGTQEQFSCEYRVRQPDGSYRWLLARGRLVRDADGTPARFPGASVDLTEQKEAEERARQSEARFRQLTELSPAIIWFGNPDGSLSYLNDRWYAYTGQTAEQALPLGWAEVIHPDDIAGLQRVWDDARAREVTYETEARLRRHDGAYRWFQILAEPLRDEGGTVAGWLGSDTDIHDRRHAEEALTKAEDQLRLAVDATGIGIFDFDLVANTLGWDDRVRELFGLPPGAAVTYDTFLAGLHPDDKAWADEAVQRALDPAGDGRFDVVYRTVGLIDGVERWVAATGQVLFEEGRAVRFVGTVRDVTRSRTAEQALRTAEERYRLAARATNDAIWDWHFASDTIQWNEAVQHLFGYAPEAVEPSGSWWKETIHPDDRPRVVSSIYAVINGTAEHWKAEYRFRRADGSYADILDRGFVLRDAHGQATRMTGAMLDITARKRAEEHQRLLTGELQHRVKNTLALVQAIASQTLRNASDPEAAREAFAARLIALGRAHDILTRSSWTAAPVAEVVQGALEAHGARKRIRLTGPDVLLGARPALSIAMAMHELATNATKYGALSNETGQVDLRWHVIHGGDEPRFSLTWSERGGPLVMPPSRRGFGTRMIERSFAADFGGSVTLTYEPTGLICRLEAPLAALQEQHGEVAA